MPFYIPVGGTARVRYAFDRWHFEDPSVIGPPYVGGIVGELALVRDGRRTCMGEKTRRERLGLCHHQHLLLEWILMIVSVRACLSSVLLLGTTIILTTDVITIDAA
jgi:hypothetical protein